MNDIRIQINSNIQLYTILLGGGTNIGPYFPPRIFIPSVVKFPAKGPEQLEKNNTFLMIFHDCYKKESNNINQILTKTYK